MKQLPVGTVVLSEDQTYPGVIFKTLKGDGQPHFVRWYKWGWDGEFFDSQAWTDLVEDNAGLYPLPDNVLIQTVLFMLEDKGITEREFVRHCVEDVMGLTMAEYDAQYVKDMLGV